MSIQELSAEEVAKLFHHYQEALAPDFDCDSQPAANSAWDAVPENERKLLVAAARLTLLDLAAKPGTGRAVEDLSLRQYFAKPGEADWGC